MLKDPENVYILFNINAYGFCYQWFGVYQFTCIYVANIDTVYFKCRLVFFVIEFIHEKDGICSLHNTDRYSNIHPIRALDIPSNFLVANNFHFGAFLL